MSYLWITKNTEFRNPAIQSYKMAPQGIYLKRVYTRCWYSYKTVRSGIPEFSVLCV